MQKIYGTLQTQDCLVASCHLVQFAVVNAAVVQEDLLDLVEVETRETRAFPSKLPS